MQCHFACVSADYAQQRSHPGCREDAACGQQLSAATPWLLLLCRPPSITCSSGSHSASHHQQQQCHQQQHHRPQDQQYYQQQWGPAAAAAAAAGACSMVLCLASTCEGYGGRGGGPPLVLSCIPAVVVCGVERPHRRARCCHLQCGCAELGFDGTAASGCRTRKTFLE